MDSPAKLFLAVGLICITLPLHGFAQLSLNPDISAIPRFILETSDGEKLDEGKRTFSQPQFTFQELEIALQGYLNPYARADIFLTVPGPDVEEARVGIEEVYASILRGLPLDLNLRLGRYRVEYGKFNRLHPHQWPFATQPISQRAFLGEEGLNALGISVSILLPTGDLYTALTADILSGAAVGEAAGIEDTTDRAPYYSATARLMSFLPVGDDSDLELGLSGYSGIHDPYYKDHFLYLNLDFKYKYRPSAYTSLTLQGEYLYNRRKVHQNQDFEPFLDPDDNPVEVTIRSSGLFLFANFQWSGIYAIGARYDWSQTPYSTDDKAQAISLFLGYYPVEETLGIRLHYQHSRAETQDDSRSVNFIGLQVLFSLGAHKAHPF
jgi:hypothetical protein